MNELTSYNSERIYWAVEQVEREAVDIDELHLDDNLFYLKSEADKVIAHSNYKRCLAMADYCYTNLHCIMGHRLCSFADWKKEWFARWYKRWLELAKKFKHNKSTLQQKD